MFALQEGAGGEGEKNGVTAAHFGEASERGQFGPVEDVALGAVGVREVPRHEARTRLGAGEKSRGADTPAKQGYAKVGNCFH